MKKACVWISVLMLVVWSLAYTEAITVESNGLNSVIKGRTTDLVSTQRLVSSIGKSFIRLKIDGFGVTSEIGKPELPVYRALVEVPDGAFITTNYTTLNVRVQNLKEQGVEVYPVQPPVPKIPDPKVEFVYDNSAYSKNEFLPKESVKVTEAGVLRSHRLYLVEIYPIRYNPATGQLRIEDFRVDVNISGGDIAGYFDRMRRYTDFYTAKLVSSISINSRELLRSIPAQQVCYVVIAPDSYLSQLTPLVEWRNSMGFYTILVPKSQAGNTAQQIRSYIMDAYNNWELPPTFVTLVGDVDQIPYFTGSGSGSPPTDLNYSLLEGNDYFPDVFLSRLSVANTTQLQDVLDKIVTYETTAWSQGYDWAQRAYFMASDDPGYHQVAEGTHLYCMNIVRNHGMTADSLFEYYGTGTPIPVALNDGRSLAVYSGHGNVDGWYGPYFNQSQINTLTNLDKYPMVQSFACLTGDFTQPECFMETWLRAPQKGAAAALGSSVTSYWDEDDIFQRRMFDAQFDSTLYWTMGFINMGKYLLYLHYGNTGTVRRYFEMYNLQGDPAMDIFTLSPETLYVSHPGAIPIGPTSITVTVTDPNGVVPEALVAIRTADSIYATGWTDQSGSVTLSITTNQVEPIYVNVTSHNHRPSTTSMMVVSDLPYVALVFYILNDDNGDGYISPLESATLDISVKNWGNQNAPGVTGILRANTEDITVTDSIHYFGDLGPGDSIFVTSAFSFTGGSSITNAQSLPFELLFISSTGDTWVSPFNLMGGTPVLAYNGVTVNDPSGNGVIDPGENADLFVSILNEGLCQADSSVAILRTNDTFIQILDSVAQYPQIPPDSSVTGTPFTIVADSSTPLHHNVSFQIQITAGQYVFTDTFELMIGVGGHYLVWDPDPNTSSGPTIANLLQTLGLQGDYSTTLTPYIDELPYYQSVFVCVGIYNDNYIIENGSPEAQALVDYLTNNAGNMYLEGGDVWYWDPQYSNGYDFGPLFGINATDDGTSDLSTVVGESGTFTENMTFAYTGENAWIDHLQPVGNGFAIFHNQTPYYICAVANIDSSNGGEYRTVGMSFELAGLQDGMWTKEELVSAIAQFFGVITKVKEETTPRQSLTLALKAPQPNPFKGNTNITFSIPKKQKVEVSVFDVTGRRIKTLMNSTLQPGVYTVKWDGTNSHGKLVSQGLYFVSLKTPTKNLTKKLALIR